MALSADVVICGAGIAGVAAADALTQRGISDVLLIDERPPLSLTSDKSSECYRNWWPGPDDAMVRLMNRSIDLLEALADATDNRFGLNRRGYLYVCTDAQRLPALITTARESAALGAGPLRIHDGSGREAYQPAPPHGYHGQPEGADLLLDPALIRRHFPYLSAQTVALLHARRCGWLSAHQLGMLLLDRARAHGARLLQGRVTYVRCDGGRVHGVTVATPQGTTHITTPTFVNAAGPLLADVGRLLDCELPVFCELHLKVAFNDYRRSVPRDAPMIIAADPIAPWWSDAERALLAETDETRWLTQPLSPGVHLRPEGGADSPIVLMLWAYAPHVMEPRFPPPSDPSYPEIVLRGLAQLLPELRAYLERAPQPIVDGGYYTRTRENRPLIGPLPLDGAYVIGALSGYGIMAAPAAAELLAAHITGAELPPYAPAFRLERYTDPAYQRRLDAWPADGQL
ncbi:NAD(P)/FAD-dependent oxidoreductase [Kallotenue papyrolyticum]|uniref:NAD(P)/FAD-dependent oxidoreductase n=1 Tax=Kallotenue papyrolyticum TaxID=1325125 RepID=UPI0004785696|nr:FAD-binding oxidoreductase [Kallotenue papyrolyticum]